MPESPPPTDATPPAAKVGRGLNALLDRLRSQLRRAIAGRLVWQGLAAFACVLWMGLLLDRLIEPPPTVRLAALITLGVGLLGWLGWVVAPRCLRRVTDRQIVTLLHSAAPDEAALLGTALDLRQELSGGNPVLNEATLAVADQAADSLAEIQLVREPSGYGSVWFATTALAGALVLAAIRPDLASTLVQRAALSEAPWPRRVELAVEGFEFKPSAGEWVRVAARGEPADIEVSATVALGETPPPTVWARGGAARRRTLSSLTRVGAPDSGERVRQLYRRHVERLDDDLTLTIRGGDARLRLRLIAAERPRLADVVVSCQPPAYLDAPPFQATAATLAALPEGSTLAIQAHSSKPLAAGRVTLRTESATSPIELPTRLADEGQAIEADLPPLLGPCVVSLTVTDSQGLASEPLDTPIEVARDTLPTARLTFKGVGGAITRDARLPLVVELDDDHGVQSVEVLVSRSESPRSLRISLEPPPALPGEATGVIDLLSLRSSAAAERRLVVEPGDRVTLTAAVTDWYDLAERSPSESQLTELEVVSPAELLARLGDAQRELRRSVDGLLADAQRLEYELDLERRRLAEATEEAPTDTSSTDTPSSDSAALERWAAERRLDARKAADGVTEVARRAEGLRRQAVNNRLDQPALVDRLATAVVGPLRRVVKRNLSSARKRLETLPGAEAPERIAAATAEVARAAAALEQVAASLDSQQSYNEVVALLRGLVREQRRVNQRTSRQKAESVRGLFD